VIEVMKPCHFRQQSTLIIRSQVAQYPP
jgi:hypothetical protein